MINKSTKLDKSELSVFLHDTLHDSAFQTFADLGYKPTRMNDRELILRLLFVGELNLISCLGRLLVPLFRNRFLYLIIVCLFTPSSSATCCCVFVFNCLSNHSLLL